MPTIRVNTKEKAAYIDNAQRLLGDARYLVKDKRWSSAFYIAVVACEEIGKFVMFELSELSDTNAKILGSHHEQKQKAFSYLLLGDAFKTGILNSAGLVGRNSTDHALKVIKQLVAHASTRQNQQVSDEIWAIVGEAIKSDEHTYISALASVGQWQKMKNWSIYSRGKVGNPSVFGEAEAQSMIKAVDRSLALLVDSALSIAFAFLAKQVMTSDAVMAKIEAKKKQEKNRGH